MILQQTTFLEYTYQGWVRGAVVTAAGHKWRAALWWGTLNGSVYLTAVTALCGSTSKTAFQHKRGKKREKWPKTWYLEC